MGNPKEIAQAINRLGLNLDFSKIRVIDPIHSEFFEKYAETLFELRKGKNVPLEMARDLMIDVSYFGTMMVHKEHADGMVSGAVHTTMHTIRPALQFIKTKPGVSLVSSIFFMCLPDRVSIFGDCAVNPNPTAEQLAEIAISSAESSKKFGIEPRVAMLSYSSGSSGEGIDVEKVRKATEHVKKKRPDLKIEGPREVIGDGVWVLGLSDWGHTLYLFALFKSYYQITNHISHITNHLLPITHYL